ncbi:MAG TPA: hypothetical protein VEA69_09880 [Tepidisphaeraceae bacterium]|nr:hypothetical protein [Tepidisphaeraceae bacterium]
MADWLACAERLELDRLIERSALRDAALNLSDPVFAELGDFLVRAVKEDHVPQLDAWLSATDRTSPMSRAETAVRQLLRIFRYVGETWGRRPFTDHELPPLTTPAVPDWSKLPDGWAVLAEPALACSRYAAYAFSDDFRESATSIVTAVDRASLGVAAGHVKRIGGRNILDWCSRMGVQEHAEASMLFDLIAFLDALELPYC